MATIIPVYGHVSSGDSKAKKIACETFVKDYDSKTATVQQMKSYSDCVSTLHPSGIPKEVVSGILVVFFIGAIIGCIKNDYDLFDRTMGFFVGGFTALMIFGFITLLCVAFMYVIG